MQRTVLVAALVFIVALSALTVSDLVRNGVSPLDVLSIMILVFLSIAIIGALRAPPDQ